jgi:nucleoside 2-deoxyribosyltransferase
MKIYLAGHLTRREEIRAAASDLELAGICVVSTWHTEHVTSGMSIHDVSESFLRRTARRDLRQLRSATHFVLFSVDGDVKFTRGGHCWENGYADALGLKIVIIGPRQNVFHYLPVSRRVDTWERALKWLKKQNQGL